VSARAPHARSAHQRQSLSRESIVEAALGLVRLQGAAKLSMRSLAAELGVTPMAIYYHVPDKDSLLDLLAEAVVGVAPARVPSGHDWERELKDYAIEPWLRLSTYPGLAAALIERPPPKRTRESMRYGVSILTTAGFDARTAMLAIVSFHTYMFGVVSMQVQLSKLVRRERGRKGAASRKPAKASPDIDFREIVDAGIDTMIAGVRVRRPAASGASTPARGRNGTRT
jgi:AcrR family transcriptional regulator